MAPIASPEPPASPRGGGGERGIEAATRRRSEYGMNAVGAHSSVPAALCDQVEIPVQVLGLGPDAEVGALPIHAQGSPQEVVARESSQRLDQSLGRVEDQPAPALLHQF